MIRTLGILAVSLAVLGGLAGGAEAKPKLALTAIDGDPDGDVGDAVADALDGRDLSVIYPKVVTRAIDKLGYEEDDINDKKAKKLTTELEADALVFAKLGKDGKHKTLKFRLYVAGKKARGFTVTFNNAKSERFKDMLLEKMLGRISGEDDKPKKIAKSEGDDEEGDDDEDGDGDDNKKPKKVAKGDDDDEEPTDDEEADIEATVSRVSPHTANRVAVRVDMGVSFQNRSLKFTQRSNFPEGPKPYTQTPVPGARVEGELYPFAFMNPKSFAAGLGFAGEYDKTLSLTLRTSAEPQVPVKATQEHWSAGVRYRIVLGSKGTSPSVTLGVGYGKRTFKTDRSGLEMASSLDIPDTTYKMIEPGLGFRIPLASSIALIFGGRALLVTDAGPIQKPESYGRAKVFGGQGQAGLDIVLGNRFAIRLVGEFSQVGFAFVGNGAMTNARDQDPETKDIGGAADRSIGGAATLAVLY